MPTVRPLHFDGGCVTFIYDLFLFLFLQIIETFDSQIPEDMQDFVSAGGLFDEIVELFVAGPIDQSKYHCDKGIPLCTPRSPK